LDAGLNVFYSYKFAKNDYYTPFKLDYNPITNSIVDDDNNNTQGFLICTN